MSPRDVELGPESSVATRIRDRTSVPFPAKPLPNLDEFNFRWKSFNVITECLFDSELLIF
jgi:hypothetical protein